MSDFRAEVVPVSLAPHPNADSLSLVRLTSPLQTTVVVKTESWANEKLAVYVPIDSIVPELPEFDWLTPGQRIKAMRLRGIFSMGLLVKAREGMKVGDNVTEEYGIKKYEAPIPQGDTQATSPPLCHVRFTDIASLRKYPNIFQKGEDVIITEKIDGSSHRAVFQDGKLHIGSHNQWVIDSPNWYWNAAKKYNMGEKLSQDFAHNHILFGEVWGSSIQMKYGQELSFSAFDVYSIDRGAYLDYNDQKDFLARLDIPTVPELYRGPFNMEICEKLAEEDCNLWTASTKNKNKIREGIVVRPPKECYNDEVGRVVLKYHSMRFLLR